jgi:hypothetical protein
MTFNSMTFEITSELVHDRIKIRINGNLHLSLKPSRFLGMQAWRILREQRWIIEYTMEGGVITTDYDSPEKWRAILAELDNVL